MMTNLDDMLAARTSTSQKRIEKMADSLLLEVKLQFIREALELTQSEVARSMGISQPSVVALELPTGKHIGFTHVKLVE